MRVPARVMRASERRVLCLSLVGHVNALPPKGADDSHAEER